MWGAVGGRESPHVNRENWRARDRPPRTLCIFCVPIFVGDIVNGLFGVPFFSQNECHIRGTLGRRHFGEHPSVSLVVENDEHEERIPYKKLLGKNHQRCIY